MSDHRLSSRVRAALLAAAVAGALAACAREAPETQGAPEAAAIVTEALQAGRPAAAPATAAAGAAASAALDAAAEPQPSATAAPVPGAAPAPATAALDPPAAPAAAAPDPAATAEPAATAAPDPAAAPEPAAPEALAVPEAAAATVSAAAPEPPGGDAPARASGRGDVAIFALEGRVVERANPYAFFAVERELPLRECVEELDRLSRMGSVGVVVLRLGAFRAGPAQLSELRAAVQRARENGKRVVAHLQDGSEAAWLLAAAAGEVYLAPATDLELDGVELSVVYLKGLLDKVGLRFDIEAVGRYKTGPEPLLRADMSPELRAELERVADAHFGLMLASVEGRGAVAGTARSVLDAGPFPAAEALRLRLVDGLKDWGGLRDELRESAGGELAVLFPKRQDGADLSSLMGLFSLLSRRPDEPPVGRPKVAVLYATGPIVEGDDPEAELWGEESVGAARFVRTIDELAADDSVRAVVLRVDSPGGSALASDHIWQALRRLRERKPLVASLADVAASGGYYIASAADIVVASPETITGSIGVFGGKLVVADLEGTLGLHAETVRRGQNAGLFSPWEPFSETGRARFRALLTATYDRFVARVAEGRRRSPREIEPLAEGRLWTGREALRQGLVDRLGGLDDALALARQKAGVKPDLPAYAWPPHRSFMELLQEGPEVRGPFLRTALAGALGVPPTSVAGLAAAARAAGIPELVDGLRVAALLRDEAVLAHAPWVLSAR